MIIHGAGVVDTVVVLEREYTSSIMAIAITGYSNCTNQFILKLIMN